MQRGRSLGKVRYFVRHLCNPHLTTLGIGPASYQKRDGQKATSAARVRRATRRAGQGTAHCRAQGHQRSARPPGHAPRGPGDGIHADTRYAFIRLKRAPCRTRTCAATRLCCWLKRTAVVRADGRQDRRRYRGLLYCRPGAPHAVASAHGVPGCVCRERSYGSWNEAGAGTACLDSGWVWSAFLSWTRPGAAWRPTGAFNLANTFRSDMRTFLSDMHTFRSYRSAFRTHTHIFISLVSFFVSRDRTSVAHERRFVSLASYSVSRERLLVSRELLFV